MYEEAEECCQRAITLESGNIQAHFNLAVALMHQKKTDHAIALFQKVLLLRPEDGMAHFLMGRCYEGLTGHLEKAISCYENAMSLLADPPRDLSLSLVLLYERNGEMGKARRLIEQLVRDSPDDPKAGLLMAKEEVREGQLGAARMRLEKLRSDENLLPADRARVLNRLGLLLDKLGDYEDAYSMFQECQGIAMELGKKYDKEIWYDRIYRNRAVTTPENVSA